MRSTTVRFWTRNHTGKHTDARQGVRDDLLGLHERAETSMPGG